MPHGGKQSADRVRSSLPRGIRSAYMHTGVTKVVAGFVLRIARELKVPVTIRKVSGGLIFWRSTDEDRHQAQEVADRLQTAQRQGGSRPGRRRGASRGASTPRTSPRQGRR